MTTKWTKKWPTEPGWYWICGQLYKGTKKNIEIEICRMTNFGVMVLFGLFYYPNEAGNVIWRLVDTPKEKIPINLRNYILIK